MSKFVLTVALLVAVAFAAKGDKTGDKMAANTTDVAPDSDADSNSTGVRLPLPGLPPLVMPGLPVPAAPVTDAVVTVTDLGSYPGYKGNQTITGTVKLSYTKGGVTIDYALEGVEEACAAVGPKPNSCGIHIHKGTSCANATDPMGHYYSGNMSDPWVTVVYTANGTSAEGSTGFVDMAATWDDAQGRVLVVHEYSGGRVTCMSVVLPPDTVDPADIAVVEVESGANSVSVGVASLLLAAVFQSLA